MQASTFSSTWELVAGSKGKRTTYCKTKPGVSLTHPSDPALVALMAPLCTTGALHLSLELSSCWVTSKHVCAVVALVVTAGTARSDLSMAGLSQALTSLVVGANIALALGV